MQDKLLVVYSVDFLPPGLQGSGRAEASWLQWAQERLTAALAALLPGFGSQSGSGRRVHGAAGQRGGSRTAASQSNAWGKVSHGIRLASVRRGQLLAAVECRRSAVASHAAVSI